MYFRDIVKIRNGPNLAYSLGDFVFYHSTLTDYTEVPLTYKLLDVPWDPELGDPNSSLFQQHEATFCNKVTVIKSHKLLC